MLMSEDLGAKFMRKSYRTADNIRNAGTRKSRREIASELGISYDTVATRAREAKLGLTHESALRGTTRIPSRDRLIRRGLPQTEIAEREQVTHQAIENYIKRSGQQETWKESRFWYNNAPKIKEAQKNQLIGKLVLAVQDSAIGKLPEEEQWPAQKVLEYQRSLKLNRNPSYSPEDLTTIFRKYQDAQNNGTKLSLRDLWDGTSIPFHNAVSRILHRVGLEPMNEPGHYDRTKRRIST